MCFGVGPSGLPIDRSTMSSPRRRAARQQLHGLRRALRDGERQAPRVERRGTCRPGARLEREELRGAYYGRLLDPAGPRRRDRAARHRCPAALSSPAPHRGARARRHRRRGDGRAGGLPHLQHPRGRRTQGCRGLADRVRVLLAIALAVAWFGTLGVRPLYKADESRYAEISREMVASGDWITPRLNGFKYFEKPPLQYWTTAFFFKSLGETDPAARL